MKQVSAYGDSILRAETVSFAEIPGQTKVFVDYQRDPLSLTEFYPSAVASHMQIVERVPEVLANYQGRRDLVCDALLETNRSFDASPETLANIETLRQADCVAVVTGQQAGLFSGPLYTAYKALSAIRMTECLRERGVSAVPVFWVAGEDHDFDEISGAHVLGRSGELVDLKYSPENGAIGKSVADIELEAEIADTIGKLFNSLPTTEFTDELRKTIGICWASGETLSRAFGRYMASVFGPHGLIILSPEHNKLKRAAAPIYSEAIRLSSDMNSALRARSGRLEEAGYHAQVRIDEGYFPLFWEDEYGMRQALKFTPKGLIRSKNGSVEFTVNEFADLSLREPQRFSPGVMLRSVVQDYLLPTACYFGGGAEIAYFAQNSEVYKCLGRPITTILHRQSFTVVEPKHARTMDRYGLEFKDLFKGQEELSKNIVEKFLRPETAILFADVEERINTQLNRLDQELMQTDVTLVENLAKRRRKIIYHLGALRKKSHRAQLLKDETARRQIENMFTALLPHGQLQERVLNLTYFADRYGPNFIDWIYSSCDLDDNGHRIVFL